MEKQRVVAKLEHKLAEKAKENQKLDAKLMALDTAVAERKAIHDVQGNILQRLIFVSREITHSLCNLSKTTRTVCHIRITGRIAEGDTHEKKVGGFGKIASPGYCDFERGGGTVEVENISGFPREETRVLRLSWSRNKCVYIQQSGFNPVSLRLPLIISCELS